MTARSAAPARQAAHMLHRPMLYTKMLHQFVKANLDRVLLSGKPTAMIEKYLADLDGVRYRASQER